MVNQNSEPVRCRVGRNFIPLLALPLVVLAATSCSSTKTLSFANAKAKTETPIHSLVTVMVDDRVYLRAAVENQMTGRLKDRGVEAYSSHAKVSSRDLEGDQKAVRQALSVWGADAALVSKLTDRTDTSEPPQFVSTQSHWEQAWSTPENSTEFQPGPWGGEVTVTVHLESKLYRLSDGELLWVGYTKTKLQEFTDDMKVIRTVSRQVVDQLAKDGLIQ